MASTTDLEQNPAMIEARQEMMKITKASITEIKAMNAPPEVVKLVLEAVQVLLGVEPGWPNAKKMLASPSFLSSLCQFDIYGISVDMFKQLQKYVNQEWFTPERVKRVSKGAADLAQWILGANACFKIIMNIEDTNTTSFS